jgi:hypothetical protein
MDEIEINVMQVGDRRRRHNGSIERVTRLHHHRVAWVNAQDGWNIRMPAVMPRAGLLAETFAPINVDCLGSHNNVLSLESNLGGAYAQRQRVSTRCSNPNGSTLP